MSSSAYADPNRRPVAPGATEGMRGKARLPWPERRAWWAIILATVAIIIWALQGGSAKPTPPVQITTPEPEMPAASWNELSTLPDRTATRGEALFEANGCGSCHSIDGSERIGPTLSGIWGSQRLSADGSSTVVDKAYIRESIMNPAAHVVPGYAAMMPSYEGLISSGDASALAAYILTLQ